MNLNKYGKNKELRLSWHREHLDARPPHSIDVNRQDKKKKSEREQNQTQVRASLTVLQLAVGRKQPNKRDVTEPSSSSHPSFEVICPYPLPIARSASLAVPYILILLRRGWLNLTFYGYDYTVYQSQLSARFPVAFYPDAMSERERNYQFGLKEEVCLHLCERERVGNHLGKKKYFRQLGRDSRPDHHYNETNASVYLNTDAERKLASVGKWNKASISSRLLVCESDTSAKPYESGVGTSNLTVYVGRQCSFLIVQIMHIVFTLADTSRGPDATRGLRDCNFALNNTAPKRVIVIVVHLAAHGPNTARAQLTEIVALIVSQGRIKGTPFVEIDANCTILIPFVVDLGWAALSPITTSGELAIKRCNASWVNIQRVSCCATEADSALYFRRTCSKIPSHKVGLVKFSLEEEGFLQMGRQNTPLPQFVKPTWALLIRDPPAPMCVWTNAGITIYSTELHLSDQADMFHRSSVHSNGYSTDGQHGGGAVEEMPTYLMEHLATFTVSKETSIMYPADGMRRLLQLEKSNGIWSQKMQMRLDQNWVLIMDYETGAVMERFPVSMIQEPTAFTSHDPMEMYNNILVFIVGEDRQALTSRSEMHIFQCQSISAQDLVEDLKLLRIGKVPPGRHAHHIPPPPATPPPEPPSNGVNVREQVSVFNAVSNQLDPRGVPQGELVPGMFPSRDGISLNDETSSTSSEKYERDVTILNHCFDDIEKFIARLQHAAAASRELERRRRNRKSKKKDLGDGMLTMRAKPPPEVEFVDIFQKFKLSFNLLAKLKAHIHDPNAPELVHFLFTPLALIVDASHDTHYGPNLPAKVVSPLLTREAVNLLINCVTSKETELWHSLGDAWLIPRDQWKGYVAPYHPVFLDGWSPDSPVMDERESATPVAADSSRGRIQIESTGANEPPISKKRRHDGSPLHNRLLAIEVDHYREPEHDDSHYSSDYFDYENQEPSPTETNRYAFDNRNYVARPERYSRDEREHSQSPGSDRDYPPGSVLGAHPAAPRDATARSDISADSIERNGAEGQQRFERSQSRWLEELRARGGKVVQVTYPRTANNDKELTVIRGEYLEANDSRKWWKARNSRGQVAHVPHTIVTPFQPGSGDPSEVFSNPLYAPPQGYHRQYPNQDSPRGERDNGAGIDMGRPTRSPPIPPPAPADWVRKERLGKKDKNDYITYLHDVAYAIAESEGDIRQADEQAISDFSFSARNTSATSTDTKFYSFTSRRRIVDDIGNLDQIDAAISHAHANKPTSSTMSEPRPGPSGIKREDISINNATPTGKMLRSGNFYAEPPEDVMDVDNTNNLASTSNQHAGSGGRASRGDTNDPDLSSDEDGLPISRTREQAKPIPPPPPPPLPPADSSSPSPTSTMGTNRSRKSEGTLSRAQSSQDLMQEELKAVLTMFREKRPNVEILTTPKVYINQDSSPDEVQKWLQAKSFSQKYYKTVRSSELRAILAKAREKVDDPIQNDFKTAKKPLSQVKNGDNYDSEESEKDDTQFGNMLKEQLRRMQSKD
uniref:Epidermal growth factor receptor kinase substrate 8 n=1 Tax=Timema genevievae TaxID=629358 RepID=A0A7R9PK78_TIMGE|nr:unnamed protein product [Timema genevievae]